MKALIFICMICVMLAMSACGRMSAVQKPVDSVYPETYTVQI